MKLLNQEMTDHDLAAWMDDLLTRIELRVLMEHEVINAAEAEAKTVHSVFRFIAGVVAIGASAISALIVGSLFHRQRP